MNHARRNYFIIVLGSLAASLLMQFLLPFPIGLIFAVAFYIALPQILKKLVKSKYGNKFVSSLQQTQGPEEPKKTCMVCGWETKKAQCPRCDSKQFHYR